jgi:hypothetical protein
MLLLFLTQGPANTGLDLATVLDGVLPALGASSLADLDWTSEAELYKFADEGNKRLAQKIGGWVDRSAAVAVTSGSAQVSMPTGYVDLIHASIAGAYLRPTSALELSALDVNWTTAAEGFLSPVRRISMDALGPTQGLLYPIPASSTTAAVIYHRFQPTIQAGSSTIPVASPVADYFAYAMLAEARRKESDQTMPEMAAHFDERLALFEQIFERYFGEAQ